MALRCNNLDLVKLLVSHKAITLNGISTYLEKSEEIMTSDRNDDAFLNKILSIKNYLLEYSIQDVEIDNQVYDLFRDAFLDNNAELLRKILETNIVAATEFYVLSGSYTRVA